jgi:hypothetical protein
VLDFDSLPRSAFNAIRQFPSSANIALGGPLGEHEGYLLGIGAVLGTKGTCSANTLR